MLISAPSRLCAACAPSLLALLLALPLGASASGPLVLDERSGSVEAWPALTMLGDPGGKLGIDAVLVAPARFAAPLSRHGTLGLQDEPVWLRLKEAA